MSGSSREEGACDDDSNGVRQDDHRSQSIPRTTFDVDPLKIPAQKLQQLWSFYRSWVRKNEIPLDVADNLMDRLIFWIPYHAPAFRETLYSLLSLHRLAVDCALQEEGTIQNSYGGTLDVQPSVPATALRIAISVLHCIMPSLLEYVAGRNSPESERFRNQSQMRYRIEKLKFLLRMTLIASYYKDIRKEQGKGGGSISVLGILRGGGLFELMEPKGLSVGQAHALQRRQQYVGRRTGRRVVMDESIDNYLDNSSKNEWKVMVADVLHVMRPLVWASAEASFFSSPESRQSRHTRYTASRRLGKAWFITLLMDLSSLGLLRTSSAAKQPLGQAEMQRRRMKLFLYLLRAPIWDKYTSRGAELTSKVLQAIPLIGGMADGYLWDYLLYCKHPYVSEEG